MSDPKYFLDEADKLLKPQSGFLSFLSGNSSSMRQEEASDFIVQAGNSYRLKKQFDKAGDQFIRAADIQHKLGNHNDSANNLVEAYKCYKTISPTDAIDALKKAIHIFLTQNGQFRRAANFTMDLADLYESVGDVPSAIQSYEQAGDYYTTDQGESLANKAFLKCADLSALTGDYSKAVELYDIIIKNSVTNHLSSFALKDYFFKSVLSILCTGDTISSEKKVGKYLEDDPSFNQTREYKLLQEIFESINNNDIEGFSQKVFEFDQFTKLDKLKTQLLLKIKTTVVDKDDDDLT